MRLTNLQKKYLKKNLHCQELTKLSANLKLAEVDILAYLKSKWPAQKYEKFVQQQQKQVRQLAAKKHAIFHPFSAQKIAEEKEEFPSIQSSAYLEKIRQFSLWQWLKKHWLHILCFALMTIFIYSNTLSNQFVSDDVEGIVKNTNMTQLSTAFTDGFTFNTLYYYVLNQTAGKSPVVFRSLNILFHFANSVLVLLIIGLLVNEPVALITAGLFLIHPINSEVVVWISAGPYSRYTLFLLLATLFFMLGKKGKKYYFFSLIFYLLGLFVGERAIVFPVIIFTLLLSQRELKKSWKTLIPTTILSAGWSVLIWFQLQKRIEVLSNSLGTVNNQHSILFSVPVAITSYLSLVFFPAKLSIYHSELLFSGWQMILIWLILLIFLAVVIWSFFKNKLVFFGLALFIIGVAPSLNPFGVNWVYAERYCYISSIGIFMVVAMIIYWLAKKPQWQTMVYTLLIITAFFLAGRTMKRNLDWRDEDSLWLATAETSPNSPLNYNNLGDYFYRHNNPEQAIRQFKKAIELLPTYADAHHNLANVYFATGQIDEAFINYQKALQYRPSLWQSHLSLSLIYYQKQKLNEALAEIQLAYESAPDEESRQKILATKENIQNKTIPVVFEQPPESQAEQPPATSPESTAAATASAAKQTQQSSSSAQATSSAKKR